MTEKIFPDWPESAFPSTFKSLGPDGAQTHRWGMTLRDYFAAKAMQGLYANPNLKPEWTMQEITAYTYQVADAMLKAREQK